MCMIYNIVEALQPTKLFVSGHGAYGFDTVAIAGSRQDRRQFSIVKGIHSASLLPSRGLICFSVRSDFIPSHIPGYPGSLLTLFVMTSSRTILPDIRDHSVRSDFTGLAIAALID